MTEMRQKKAYWNRRTKDYKNDLPNMVLADRRFHAHDRFCRDILALFNTHTVLDVCCGYGRFADMFKPELYTGFDFSDEMIKKAREIHPEYHFIEADAEDFKPPVVDVVFQAISLAMLGMTEEQFIETYKPYARKAIICLGVDDYKIHLIL